MSTRDLLLSELYHVPRDEALQALVTRHAPIIYFDAREPFLPVAAGYTVFTQDSPSPSFDRIIELRPEADDEMIDRAPAALAIEYAIWFDWDIHHLYELEHIWIYLDDQDQTVRVEASWHGKFYDIPITLENGRAVLLSEPGKHAFAPHPDWFRERQRDFQRSETRDVGTHAHVLINNMFAGKIRERMFDRVLVRSYLAKQAFQPAWSFTQRYTFPSETLVPWGDLFAWVPLRVNAWLERLETHTRPADYQALHLTPTDGSLPQLKAAVRDGAHAVIVPVSLRGSRLVIGGPDLAEPLDLDEALRFFRSVPMGAFLEVNDPAAVEHLAWFIRSKDLQWYAVVTSADPALLTRYNSFVPGGVTAIQIISPEQDPVHAASVSKSVFIHLRWENLPDGLQRLTPDWIDYVHSTGLGFIGWPSADPAELSQLEHLGLDVVCPQLSPDGASTINPGE